MKKIMNAKNRDCDAIVAQGLCKSYDSSSRGKGLLGGILRKKKIVHALRNVSFRVKRGEFVGYVGQNGSGKSTTIKMLTGVLTPTQGNAQCLGMVPWEERIEYTKRIGVVFGQKTLLHWDLPVIESLKLYKDIYELSWKDFDARVAYFNEILGIKKLLEQRVRKLSFGERMRCELAAALLHKPEIVFLDEPTIGLDVVAKEEVRAFLREINEKEKTTVLLTTHDMGDIEALCERVIILDNGRKVYDGGLEELERKYVWKKYVDIFYSKVTDKSVFNSVLKKTSVISHKKDFVSLSFNSKVHRPAEIISGFMRGCRVVDLSVREPELREIIAQIYRKGGV